MGFICKGFHGLGFRGSFKVLRSEACIILGFRVKGLNVEFKGFAVAVLGIRAQVQD